jgi:hypothetical protein
VLDVEHERFGDAMSALIARLDGRFHFGSLICCTAERGERGTWKDSGVRAYWLDGE